MATTTAYKRPTWKDAKLAPNGKPPIWAPQPRQGLYMSRWEYEAMYGGAAGGGKTDTLLIEALRQVHIPHYRALFLRKTYPQLQDAIDRSRFLYRGAYPTAKYNSNEHCWNFPSGAKVYFGSMNHPSDKTNYQGKQYDLIEVDEMTHFTWDEYSYMFSRNRPNGPGTLVYMRGATNPGGIGHGWVKQRFITPAAPMTTIIQPLRYRDGEGRIIQAYSSRIFVPAKVTDNKILLENNPMYERNLSLLGPKEKAALLDGSWDSFSGQVFMEWMNRPTMLSRTGQEVETHQFTHVIKPFRIPGHWRIYCGLDWGFSKPFSVGWFAVDEIGCIYHFKEFYGTTGQPNEGVCMNVPTLAREILRIEAEEPVLRGRKIERIADPAIFQEDGLADGPVQSVSQQFEKYGVLWRRGSNARIPGWQQFHNRMQFDEKGFCMFYVFETCYNFIRTFPELIYDEKHPEDVDTKQEDHAPDMARYVLMDNPYQAKPLQLPKPPVGPDPLGLITHKPGFVYLGYGM